MRSTAILAVCAMLQAASPPYKQALPGYQYRFPADHFVHEDFRTEWWYYTGNVTDTAGSRFGFELVFFRNAERHETDNISAWNAQQLYLAHAALTDVKGGKFNYDERLNRSGPGVAGAAANHIWNGNWSVVWTGDRQALTATTDNFRFQLQLVPDKPFVIHGENGVSQKGEGTGRASHYVSFPRLVVQGEITSGTAKHQVKGTAWMDHEWFTNNLSDAQLGWNWLSIQLDNRTELMLYEFRRKDSATDPHSAGTYIDAQGQPHHLTQKDFELTPLATSNGYPTEWRIQIPALKIDLKGKAVLANQELKPKQGGPSYWEGAVDFSGSHKGVGYLEMTGYKGAVKI